MNKPIPGYEATYYAKDDGTIWRIGSSRPLKTSRHNGGYRTTRLCQDGKQRTFTVHRLMGMTFLDDFDPALDVCHKDHDRTNNMLLNLCMGTRKENCQMSAKAGRYGKHTIGTRYRAKLSTDDYQVIRDMYATGKYKQSDLASLFGVIQCRISQIIRSDPGGKTYPRRVV